MDTVVVLTFLRLLSPLCATQPRQAWTHHGGCHNAIVVPSRQRAHLPRPHHRPLYFAFASCLVRTREGGRADTPGTAVSSRNGATLCSSTRPLSTSCALHEPQRSGRDNAGARRPTKLKSTRRAPRPRPADPESSCTADFMQDARQQHHGIFQSQHIKPFPVRAAIDIGTGGVMSLCIGRVDARVGAVQRLMYQTQLPLYLEKSHPTCSSDNTFTLSERTADDVKRKMRVLHGVMRRNAFEGLSERAAVLSWPLCLAANAKSLANELTREFKVDVRVLGDTFNVQWPPSVIGASAPVGNHQGEREAAVLTQSALTTAGRRAAPADASLSPRQGEDRLKALLRSAASAKKANSTSESASIQQTAASSHPADLRAQVDQLAFLSHAAASQCVAPQRLLVLSEDPQRGVRLLGMGVSPAAEVADLLEAAESAEAVAKLRSIAFAEPIVPRRTATAGDGLPSFDHQDGQQYAAARRSASGSVVPVVDAHEGLCLVEHTLPVDVASAHRYCITHIQRRPPESYGLHTSSPNPMLPEEFSALRFVMSESIRHGLPRWVTRKSQLGGMLVSTSHNGGLFNIAARVSQQTNISLDHLEVHAQHHFCGLTDVMLAENFPNPLLVLPSAALSAAILRALESPRMRYVPEVSVAAALLVQPSLWLASRAAEVRRRRLSLEDHPLSATHTSARRGLVFERPHRKDNPTAAPDAARVMNERWNPLSYEQGMQGT
ncbi:hypothetical protein ABL78_6784 [Leptomonas seymouri]|uniref:Uncharacterized protein n=1 Tax=Leptomonas seymouri TaxID=5684 RepID=A0A0N0P3I3_LEPSE|nr:hypothetical protein ABL78_6784 [Leptomonas seymouri]|eukprot:KPI84159.1 hypothetical protein ABL78_6784 [Leptomonas seymouri]